MKSKCRDDSPDDSDGNSDWRMIQKTCWGSNGHPTGKRGINNILHYKQLAQESAHHKGRQAAPSQRINSVCDDLILLVIVIGGCTKVKRRPVHPKEECSNHSDSIGVWAWLCLFRCPPLLAEHPTYCQSKIGPKRMNYYASSSVENVNLAEANNFVKWVADDLDDCCNQQLPRTHSANESSKSDENGCHAVTTLN